MSQSGGSTGGDAVPVPTTVVSGNVAGNIFANVARLRVLRVFVGPFADGKSSPTQAGNGITLYVGATDAEIGGFGPTTTTVISGNGQNGILCDAARLRVRIIRICCVCPEPR